MTGREWRRIAPAGLALTKFPEFDLITSATHGKGIAPADRQAP